MKCVYITQYCSAPSTRNNSRSLVENGHEVTVFTPTWLNEKRKRHLENCASNIGDKVRVIHRKFPYPFVLAFSLAFFSVFIEVLARSRARARYSKLNIDIIIAQYHTYHMAPFTALLLSKILSKPLLLRADDIIFTIPTSSKSNILKKLYRHFAHILNSFALKRSQLILVNSQECRNYVSIRYKIDLAKIKLHFNGVRWELYQTNKSLSDIKRELEIDAEHILVFVGGFYELRGLEIIIDAVPYVLKEFPNTLAILVGDGGKYALDLKRRVHRLGLERNVLFTGYLSHKDAIRYIQIADITIGPLLATLQTFGTMPKKIAEYMACSKPIVACKGGQSSSLIIDEYNGLLCKSGDSYSFIRAVVELLRNNDKARKLGRNGNMLAKNKYTFEKMKEDLDKWIKDLMFQNYIKSQY